MKKLALLLCMTLVLSLFAGCSSTSDNSTTPTSSDQSSEYKDTITLVNEMEPDTLDPRRGNGVSNNIVMNLIYDSLVTLDANGQPQPRLAESWELVDDTHLKLKLREDVVFSNGSKFNADDVLFSLERTLHDPTSQSTMAWYDPDNSTKEDDYTVTLAMKYPYAAVYWVLSGWRCWMGDMETMQEVGEEAHARAPIGTGPYKLTDWIAGSQLNFTANENYWGEAPKTPNLVLKIVAEPANRVIELETGGADFSYYINSSDRQRVEDLDGYHVEAGVSEKYYLVAFNMQHEILSNPKVREALFYAIDRKELTDAAFDGMAHVMPGMYPTIIQHSKEMPGMKFDPEQAKALLAEAGYPDGFEIELHILPGAEYQRMAEIVQAYWSNIGVTATIDQSALATREAQGPWEASIRTATADEISNILIIYEIAFGSRINSNDEVLDGMLQKLKQTYDDSERKNQLSKIQDYLFNAKYSVPFAEVDTVYGVSDKIEGFEFSPKIALLNIPEWKIKK